MSVINCIDYVAPPSHYDKVVTYVFRQVPLNEIGTEGAQHLKMVEVKLSAGAKMSNSTKSASTVNAFVGDSSQLSCQLIATALRRGRNQARVVGYATDADGIREGLQRNETDVAIIGARLQDGALAGLNVTRQIRASHPKLGVIMLLDS